ncbi:TolB family protein [Dyadobacter endophyticus]|uniref:TolB family protein n=1 Tax=Dyadobacter endophyticus TaxID=1749036 RepID=UPI003CF33089
MRKLLPVISLFLVFSCWPPGMDPDKKDGKFLSDVVNLEEINSEYDDYNSDLPNNRHGDLELVFSSRREKKDVLNLVHMHAYMDYGKHLSLKKGRRQTGGYFSGDIYNSAQQLVGKANGNFNVYGPKFLSLRDDLINYGTEDDLFLLYADDSSGKMDIKYTRRGTSAPEPVRYLNSPANDAYPSFSWTGDRIYFCSDRDGNFDIYEVKIPRKETEKITIESIVASPKYELRKVEELSGPYNDKCPYIQQDMMVFVSDRPGGQGGEDIYYSEYKNGKWSTPINAGPRINSSHNEYRPILPSLPNFNYPLMLFSSNRPGGKGGYDLYMTGLKRDW